MHCVKAVSRVEIQPAFCWLKPSGHVQILLLKKAVRSVCKNIGYSDGYSQGWATVSSVKLQAVFVEGGGEKSKGRPGKNQDKLAVSPVSLGPTWVARNMHTPVHPNFLAYNTG